MPSQLFVDSDEENGDFGSDQSEEENASKTVDATDDMEDDGDDEAASKGKKRKTNNHKEARLNKKAKKLKLKELKRSKRSGQLTTAEIKELSVKEYAQYSNLYNVQIEEVLRETCISKRRKNEVLKWYEDFKVFVGELRKSKKFPMQDYENALKPIKIPLPEQVIRQSSEWMVGNLFQWFPPSSVNIRGSWAVDTALNKVSALDIYVEIPYDYLAKSDFLNHKYHFKRVLYIGFLAKKLKKRGDDVKFTHANGEPLKPVISIHVNKVKILIHAVPPKGYFKLRKLACERNNLRYEHFFGKPKSEDEPETSTYHYNFTILEDALVSETNEEVTEFLNGKSNFRDAIKLLKIWLTQRDLLKMGFGGLSGVILTQFMRYLFSKGKISDNMTSFQLIRMFFVNIIQMNLVENGISFNDDVDVKLAHLQWDVVFLDSTGLLNYTANVSKHTYKRVQQEAKGALHIIDEGNTTGFLALFITRVKFMLNFDHVVRFTQLDQLRSYLEAKSETQSLFLNYSGFLYPIAVSIICPLIETALGERITLLDVELPESQVWEVHDDVPLHTPSVMRFGMCINRELSHKLIEKCESDSEPAIELFKQFWGEKCELRRFKDGTLLESVVLNNLAGLGTSRICYQMLSYIFDQHLGYKLSQNEYIDKQIEKLVENQYAKAKLSNAKPMSSKKIYVSGKLKKKKIKAIQVIEETVPFSVDDVNRQVSSSFDELSKILRMLEELPLAISTVQGTSSVLRFSNVQPTPPQIFPQSKVLTDVDPKRKSLLLKKIVNQNSGEGKSEYGLPSKLPKYVEPVGVIIHLETSGQWPDEIKAIERLKCAFLIKIGELLTNKFGLTVQPFARHLDVLKDGFVFRISITYFRELTLLRQLQGSDGVLRIRDNAESLRLEKEALILPQLTSTLHSFHLQFEAFGKTCRIAKRWIASQLLLSPPIQYNRNLEDPDCRLSEESVELLVAYLFLNYAPHLTFPSEAHVGFQRFLYLLANTDFRVVPIILNFNDKLTSQEVSAVELEFVKIRSTLPSLFIATTFDLKGSVWTRSLSQIILNRAQLLAKQALLFMENQFEDHLASESDFLRNFRPDTKQFDVIIRLKNQTNPRYFQSLERIANPVRFQEYQKKLNELIPVVDFDPVQMFLQDLRHTFGHMAIFLHDLYGGQFIAVVWKPDVFKSTSFTTSTVKGRELGKNGNSVVANVNGALEAFQIMGHGIVDRIDVQSDRWKFDD